MFLLAYTRQPIDSVHYDPRLAYSLHLGISEDGTHFKSLNHDSGILFALATENEDGSLNPRSLRNPFVFALPEGGFGILAVRTLSEGEEEEESKGCVLYWTSPDLIAYKEVGLIRLDTETVKCVSASGGSQGTELIWETESGVKKAAVRLDTLAAPAKLQAGKLILTAEGRSLTAEETAEYYDCRKNTEAVLKSIVTEDMEGTVPCQILEVDDRIADRLRKKLMPPVNDGVTVPEEIKAADAEAVRQIRAAAHYSDGQIVEKRVDWDLSEVDFSKPGKYPVQGKLIQEHFPFPVAFNRADPCICYWEGKYYFIATNDADGNHTLYVRKSDTMEGLCTAEEQLILDSSAYEEIGNLLWAPEFHEINGRLYIFHAATPNEFFKEESHIMELREGGDPACREDWSKPKRIVRMDGSELCEAGKVITLDMTCFEWEGAWYVIWSQRQFLPKDLGAWLYIAKLNPEKPWMLASEPLVLSKPDYGWGNNHTFVEEGPYCLYGDRKLFVTFSAAAVDSSYVVSYLEISSGRDLLVRENWRKNNYPILTSRSVKGEFGTGHNAYVTDEFGTIWNTYHARPGEEGVRSSGIRRVFFDIDGCPVLDVTENMDLVPEYGTVSSVVVVE